MENKDPKKIKRGKTSRAQGTEFEKRVRKDLESKNWIVDKWSNNVEFDIDLKEVSICPGKSKHTTIKIDGKETNSHIEIAYTKQAKLSPAKPHMVFNPIIKRMIHQQNSSGFPDFACTYRTTSIITTPNIKDTLNLNDGHQESRMLYEFIGVESKMDGKLDKLEKQKCQWLLDNNIFSKILIARKEKIKNRINIIYEEFK